ncbi:hypothetical protein CI424_25245 [Salmonella enterica subsp. enterica serovar Enteritidis]|nr:hypothetical protein [Salmonella enterica subsp. enterica serovar Enteritidis]
MDINGSVTNGSNVSGNATSGNGTYVGGNVSNSTVNGHGSVVNVVIRGVITNSYIQGSFVRGFNPQLTGLVSKVKMIENEYNALTEENILPEEIIRNDYINLTICSDSSELTGGCYKQKESMKKMRR